MPMTIIHVQTVLIIVRTDIPALEGGQVLDEAKSVNSRLRPTILMRYGLLKKTERQKNGFG
jgi:hypothetical protein